MYVQLSGKFFKGDCMFKTKVVKEANHGLEKSCGD